MKHATLWRFAVQTRTLARTKGLAAGTNTGTRPVGRFGLLASSNHSLCFVKNAVKNAIKNKSPCNTFHLAAAFPFAATPFIGASQA
jgi:hypothetical protein